MSIHICKAVFVDPVTTTMLEPLPWDVITGQLGPDGDRHWFAYSHGELVLVRQKLGCRCQVVITTAGLTEAVDDYMKQLLSREIMREI